MSPGALRLSHPRPDKAGWGLERPAAKGTGGFRDQVDDMWKELGPVNPGFALDFRGNGFLLHQSALNMQTVEGVGNGGQGLLSVPEGWSGRE